MADEPKRYVIKTVGDFLQVPEERQEQCLKEFAIFLQMTRFMTMLADDVANGSVRAEAFEWIDDGALDVKVKLVPVDNLQPNAHNGEGNEQ